MSYRDLVIIGGGSAGLNAAISAYESGVHDILIIEQANRLGGILNQCIHNGFGLHWFKEELTGPGFAQKSIDKVHEFGIEYLLNTTVINVSTDSEVEYVSPQGSDIIQAKSVIFSVGCYERSRGAISIPGYRPKGIFTA
jgi:thioredoxin reductase